MAFTVAAVPTGMKAGVRMTPRGMRISPVRAAPSVLLTVKVKVSVVIRYLVMSFPAEVVAEGKWESMDPQDLSMDPTSPRVPRAGDDKE